MQTFTKGKKMKTTKLLASIVVIVGILVLSSASNAGNLEPIAPPGSTMKTLDEVQPGTPISSIPYTIAESGYYYLTSSVQNSSSMFHGITIWADNVTVDLKGFSMIGDETAGLHGVAIEGTHRNITICDGTIRDFDHGIYENDSLGTGHRFIGIKVLSNKNDGIRLFGNNHLVRDCTVSNNGTSASGTIYGILVQDDSSVTNNRIYNNGASVFGSVEAIKAGNGCEVISNIVNNNGIGASSTKGIYTNPFCTITDNTVIRNGGGSGTVLGIWASGGSTVRGNTVCSNGNSASGDVKGILANPGCTVSNNTVSENGNSSTAGDIYGIHASSGCLVSNNVVYKNGYGASSESFFAIYGIYAGDSCTVMNNTASANGGAAECFDGPVIYGIFIEAGSTVMGNTASKNATPISSAVATGICIGKFSLVDQNTAYDNNGTPINNPGNCSFGVNMPQLP
jgi:hypothetical protein